MQRLKMYQIDAFTDVVFRGNPAAVVPLQEWLPDERMQGIAAENNLAETAFFVPDGDGFALRWFTPRHEMDLCGHATLASAFVLFAHLDYPRDVVRFETRGGTLTVRRDDELLAMDFPTIRPKSCPSPPVAMRDGLNIPPRDILVTDGQYFAIYEREDEVRAVAPDLGLLETLHPRGVVVTAPGAAVDFVSRYFAPSYGVPEDPVTGSSHSTLVPYWGDRLGKQRLHARQVSARGGDLWCEDCGDRVIIAGYAVRYLEGDIYL